MKSNTIKSLLIGFFSLLLGCSQYHSKPLAEQAIQQQLETPAAQQLSIHAAQILHPLLIPVPFNIQDGLSPDEAAILAVLRNPELRAARDQHGIANAQLLQAGLLPNPTFSYNFAALSGGLDQGKVTGLGLSLGWEVTSLITQSNKLIAAEAEQQAVDLHIAWQEWQIAQAAKLAVYQLLVFSKQQLLLEEMVQRLESNRVQIQQAYKNQDEQVHIKVLQQFPQISIGFTQTKNPSAYYTLGAGVTVTLPIFDQTQGQIALAEATRQQLFDEYTNRVFQSKADIAELLVTIASLNKQIQSIHHAIPDLENLVNTYKLAIENGQIDVLNYYVSWNNLTDKKIELLSLQLQLVEARIALEIATGIYHLQI